MTADSAGRWVTLCRPSDSALVLGSGQPDSDVDFAAAAARSTPVVRRRTGGGAVLVVPGQLAWVEISIGREDELWEPDVSRSSLWLGRAWVRALDDLGVSGSQSHSGASLGVEWSRRLCFAGVGPGEVLLNGRKVVGISQRRSREAAVFQCAALLAWEPARVLELMSLSPNERQAAAAALDRWGTGLGERLEVGAVERSLVAQLP